MVLGNIERLEIVVGSLHLRPGDHRIAERKKNPLDFLERLSQRVPRAERARDSRKRNVFALAGKRRLFARGFNRCAPRFERGLDVSLQFVKRLADRAFQLRLGWLEPVLCDASKHARFSTEPGAPQLFPTVRALLRL